MKGLLIGFLLAGMAPLLAAPPAESGHFCAELDVTFSPETVPAGQPIPFVTRVENTGLNDTQMTAVEIRFGWETAFRTIGAGQLNAGEADTFVTTATVPSEGFHNVTIQITAFQGVPADSATCTFTEGVTAFGVPGGGATGFIAFGLVLAAVVAVLVIVVVLVVVIVAAKQRGARPPQIPPSAPPPPPP